MPLYEYECMKCRHRFERIQKFSDPPADKCPDCGGKVEQLISAPALQFKGSGWYVTDYARKGSGGSDSGGKSEGARGESKSESKSESGRESKSESKNESKTESKSESKTDSKSDSKRETQTRNKSGSHKKS